MSRWYNIERISAAVFLFGFLSGCIAYTTGVPPVQEKGTFPGEVVYYQVSSLSGTTTPDTASLSFETSFKALGIGFVRTTSHDSAKNHYPYVLDIQVREGMIEPATRRIVGNISTGLSCITLTGFPGLMEKSTIYRLQILKYDNARNEYSVVKSKEYAIEQHVYWWVGLLPFFWVNFIVHNPTDIHNFMINDFLRDLPASHL